LSGIRIGWATPWNEQSAIAHMASDIAEELTGLGHEITILRSESEAGLELKPRESSWPVLPIGELSDDELSTYFDITVCHIGDNMRFHGGLIPRLGASPCVGIFHDAFIANLAADWAHGPGGGVDALRAIVHELYGEEAWPSGQTYLSEAILQEVADRRPMIEWLASKTVGAVAHSSFYLERLQRSVAGPVTRIPLAMRYGDLPPPPPAWRSLTIAVIGHANPNKRIDQVILGVASSPFLRDNCHIRVIGEASEGSRNSLVALSNACGVAPPEFTGWVTDEVLRWRLRDVDVISCLRDPVLEGGSASLILAMSSERPTLVSDQGCYQEAPKDSVLACSPGAEAVDVMRHLETLLLYPEKGKALGQKAASFARTSNSTRSYAEALVSLLEEVMIERRREKTRASLRRTLREFGLSADDTNSTRILSAIDWTPVYE
jgi:glycosyltransferase involved in cell wall biosynthesis